MATVFPGWRPFSRDGDPSDDDQEYRWICGRTGLYPGLGCAISSGLNPFNAAFASLPFTLLMTTWNLDL
jgi:hypothetical protein